MKVLAQTFALFLAITPLLAAPVPLATTDAVAETGGAHVAHHHHHHHTEHHATEERSLFSEEEFEERSFDDEEAMLERRGAAMSSLKPKKKEEKSFEVTRRPGPKQPERKNSVTEVQHVQHQGMERKGPLRVVNQKRGAAMSSLKPKKKEEKSFEVTRRPGPKQPERKNSVTEVQHVQHQGMDRKGPLRVVNQKRGAAMSSLKPKKKEEKSFEVTRRPGPKQPERKNSVTEVQHVQHQGMERKGPLRVVNQKRGAAMSSLKPKKKEEKSFEVTRRPGPKQPERKNSVTEVQHVQHQGMDRKGPLRVVNQKRGNGMSSLKPKKKEEKSFEVTRRPGPKQPERKNSVTEVQHVQHQGMDRKGPLRVTNP